MRMRSAERWVPSEVRKQGKNFLPRNEPCRNPKTVWLNRTDCSSVYYEDMVNGKLSEARFQMLSDDYEKEQEELRAKIEVLENEIQNQEDQAENVDRFIRQAKKYLYLEKLTPTILNEMVNAVYVHAPDKSSGHRVQDVTISYNYIGILPANLLYDVMNGKAA